MICGVGCGALDLRQGPALARGGALHDPAFDTSLLRPQQQGMGGVQPVCCGATNAAPGEFLGAADFFTRGPHAPGTLLPRNATRLRFSCSCNFPHATDSELRASSILVLTANVP